MNTSMPEDVGGSAPAGSGQRRSRFVELASDALRYWEPRRVLYNIVLLLVVAVEFFVRWPTSKVGLNADTGFVCFILAVLANVAYCAAYGVDLFVQFAGLRAAWGRTRWVLLLVGTAFAAAITHFFTEGLFEGGRGQ